MFALLNNLPILSAHNLIGGEYQTHRNTIQCLFRRVVLVCGFKYTGHETHSFWNFHCFFFSKQNWNELLTIDYSLVFGTYNGRENKLTLFSIDSFFNDIFIFTMQTAKINVMSHFSFSRLKSVIKCDISVSNVQQNAIRFVFSKTCIWHS